LGIPCALCSHLIIIIIIMLPIQAIGLIIGFVPVHIIYCNCCIYFVCCACVYSSQVEWTTLACAMLLQVCVCLTIESLLAIVLPARIVSFRMVHLACSTVIVVRVSLEPAVADALVHMCCCRFSRCLLHLQCISCTWNSRVSMCCCSSCVRGMDAVRWQCAPRQKATQLSKCCLCLYSVV
jgi:hypothetical protein